MATAADTKAKVDRILVKRINLNILSGVLFLVAAILQVVRQSDWPMAVAFVIVAIFFIVAGVHQPPKQ